MTPEKAKEFIKNYPKAISFVKPSHLEELSDLLECHIEVTEVTKGEFHELENGKVYMPRKETLDKFASAAGVSYNEAAESTRMEGDGVYVGRSQAMVMGPDGKMILGSACEYEFGVATRLLELELNQKYDYDKKEKRDYTELELKKERVQFLKVGRQRANTGARSRATLMILGMQTGFKGLFQKNDPDNKSVTFLFSRIIINAKNEFVMSRMLDGIAGNTAALYGPQVARALPPAQAEDLGPVDFKHAEDQQTGPADDQEGDDGFDFSDDPEINGSADKPAVATDKEIVDAMITTLEEWAQSNEISSRAKEGIADVLKRNVRDRIILEDLLKRVKANAKAFKESKRKAS